jgi:hypothetical protein
MSLMTSRAAQAGAAEMGKSRHPEAQIIAALKKVVAGRTR